jgi:integrase/recombinase XerD
VSCRHRWPSSNSPVHAIVISAGAALGSALQPYWLASVAGSRQRRCVVANGWIATGLDRNELGALLVAAGLGPPAEHALISLLALNGLRVSEATGVDIEALGIERGHRTLVITRKGGKVVTIPLAPRTARAIDLAIGERTEGPIFLAADGRRLDRHGAGRIVRRIARQAGITKTVGPHTLRHAFITAALDAGVPLRDVQEAASHADPRTTMRYDRARASLERHATYIVAAYVAGAAR